MKIFGIGIDIVQNKRIESVLSRTSALRFITKVLHSDEIKQLDALQTEKMRAQFVASRWAVKEATVKALGRKQLVFSDLKITKDSTGKPHLQACNKNQDILLSMGIEKIHISLAHEDDYTTAQALATLK